MPFLPTRRPNGAGFLRLAPALVLAAVGLGACDDERATINDPDIAPVGPEADFIFGTTFASAGTFRLLNDVVEKAIPYFDSGATLPVTFAASSGTGSLRLSRDGVTGRIRADFDNYQDMEIEPTFDTILGQIEIQFLQTSGGLRYAINPDDGPFLPFGPGPHALIITLIPQANGITFVCSGPIFAELVNADPTGLQGIVRHTGTVRLESGANRFLVVETLATEYEYDGRVDGSFASYPAGSYTFSGFANGVSASPFVVEFDGFGGVGYPYRGGFCEGNLLDLENGNSCAGL